MTTLLYVWACVGVALMLVGGQSRYPSAGLPLAYFFELSLIHVPGALIYTGSDNWEGTADLTRIGFEQTVYGMIAFLTGVILARQGAAPLQKRTLSSRHLAALNSLAWLYMVIGFCSFMSMSFLSSLPSIGAIGSALSSLMIAGVSLRLWVTREAADGARWGQTVAMLPLLPLLTLVKDGFLSFGTHWMLSISGFLFNQSRRGRAAFILAAPIVGFVGLSLFVNYMAARTEFRQMVWYQQADVGDRFKRIGEMFDKFEWLDLASGRQRAAIDERLNQNVQVGLAAIRLDSHEVDYASGATFGSMFISLIPRAIWPEKPAVGGGADLVSHYTGVQFATGTSVGAGQVFEFYINFGAFGVVAGFFLWGWLMAKMDMRAVNSLASGDQSGFLLWFLASLAMVQPGGNLIEIVVSAASAAVASKGLTYVFKNRFHGSFSPLPARRSSAPVIKASRRLQTLDSAIGLPRLPRI